jgi:D-alanyl-D-alanine carboxypeptidase/D-alanyl-D-alanine-endopeptidase (penicillin-binding protein 4)
MDCVGNNVASRPEFSRFASKLRIPLLCLFIFAATINTSARARIAKGKLHAPLATVIATILSAPELSHAHWGISVVTSEGRPIYALNDGQFFAPASNAKLFTTAAAFALLGPDFVSKTYVVEQGEITSDGHLAGSVRLVGTGDPSLSGRTYPYDGKTERPDPPLHVLDELAAEAANEMNARGIHQIDGPVVGDSSFFPFERYGLGWGWDDLQWGYGAPVSALTVNDNVVYLGILPGANVGDAATIAWDPALPPRPPPPPLPAPSVAASPDTPPAPAETALAPFYEAENTILTTGASTSPQIGVDRQPGSDQVRLYGSVPLDSNGAHLALALDDPAAFAASAFAGMLAAHGVGVSRAVRTEETQPGDTRPFEQRVREPLELHPLTTASLPFNPAADEAIVATHASPPLTQEATVINKVSQNLHAELLLRELGKSQTGEGSFVEGARVVRQFLINAGVSADDFMFYDGSGLSPLDQITPRATTTLLAYAANQPWGIAYRSTLPVGGVDGSLAVRFLQSPLKGNIFAKTGTLAEVNALSGYLIAASGRTVVFSILCNARRPSSDAERKAIDQIAEAIAAAN